MGLWETLTGRSRVKRPNLDALFGIPSAAITLEAAAGFTATGVGSVCFRGAAGGAFAQVQADVIALIRADADAPEVQVTMDDYGFTWLTVHDDPSDLPGLCTDLHAVNTSLEAQGFDGGLLCTLVPFQDSSGRRFGLVYLYKQGTFYAFAPQPGGQQKRDNLLEISVRDQLAGELPMEADLGRWLAVWGAPGL
jgi:hypothetical protein